MSVHGEPVAALFHAAMNTAFATMNVLWGDLPLYWLCVASSGALAMFVVAHGRVVRSAAATGTPAIGGTIVQRLRTS